MIVKLKGAEGGWFDLLCEEVVIPLGDESEFIAISVINEDEILVIRHSKDYPNEDECVWSEILSEHA